VAARLWPVLFHPLCEQELHHVSAAVQDELLAMAKLLEQTGPELGRPWADTLNGSQHSQMKEMRFRADGGVWRVAFAFDPHRAAILLIAADKRGQNERRFYRRFITAADQRFNEHLAGLSEAGDTQ